MVLVTPRSYGAQDPQIKGRLEAEVGEVRYNDLGRPMSSEELCGRVGDVDGLVAGLDEIDRRVFEAAPRLRVVSRYGVGTDRVDLDAATEHGVLVTNTPGANATAVAELSVALTFALSRRVAHGDRAVRNGGWPTLRGRQLQGRTVGVLGFGRIGRQTARLFSGLGCKTLAYDPFPARTFASQHGVGLVSQDELVSRAEVLSLHLPLTEHTADLVDERFIERMPRGALLVNTARGGLIVEKDLLDALDEERIGGAALDTLRQEPPPLDHPLIGREDVILTPHTGPHTAEATIRMGRDSTEDLLRVLSGGEACFPVNSPITVTRGG